MKFSINKEKLILIISEYNNILKENPVKPILAGLFISVKNNRVIFKGINTEIEFIRYDECIAEDEGEILIKPQLLLEYIKLVEVSEIYFEKKEGYLIVNDAEFSILDENLYPEVTEFSTLVATKINSIQLSKMLNKVAFLSTSNNMDILFNSIKIKLTENYIELVSTDSYRLIYLKETLKNNLERDLLIPTETALVIYKILKELDTEVSISVNDDKLILLWENAYFSCRLLSLTFPDYESLINNFKSNRKFEFNSEELSSSLKKVISVTKNSIDTKNVASFNFKDKQLNISGVSSNAKINQKVNMIKTGEDLKIGINCKYMKDYLDNIYENVIIYAISPTSMIKMTEDKNENYIYLLMPVNVKA